MFNHRPSLLSTAAALAALAFAVAAPAGIANPGPNNAGAALPASGAVAPAPAVIELWPGVPPGETASPKPEKTTYHKNEVVLLTNVWKPTLEFHAAPAAVNTGATVLVCPGGAYQSLATRHEGTFVAEFFNSIGVNVAVLKYRVPRRPAPAVFGEIALKDSQRALSLLRSQADTLKIDPARIGVMGFSAGGHLAAITSAAKARTFDPVDTVDEFSCRPDFTILVYPAYMTVNGRESGASKEERARLKPGDDALTVRVAPAAGAPPAICFHSINDPYTSDGSLLYHRALRQLGIQSELHIYATGGHGWGFNKNTPVSDSLRASLAAWMKNHWATAQPKKQK